MELGDPPIYAILNRVAREMDIRYLKELGPFSMALGIIALRAEHFKNATDLMVTGEM